MIAWIIESIPALYAKSSAVSAAIVGGGPSIGFAVGALLTGIWVESLKMPLQWLILLLGTAAALMLPAIYLSAETAHCRPIPLKDLLMPALKLPKRIRPIFLPFMAAVIGGWTLGAFAQAFSAPLAETLLGHDDRLAAAVVFVGFIALFAWGGFLLRGSALRALQYSLVLIRSHDLSHRRVCLPKFSGICIVLGGMRFIQRYWGCCSDENQHGRYSCG